MSESNLKLLNQLLHEANNGDVQSMIYLGDIYYQGIEDIEQDILKAYMYWKMAADTGNPMCCTKIAMVYYYGMNVVEDKNTAYKYFEKAASLGETEALYFLGKEYSEGNLKSSRNNFEFARDYLEKAARNGHAQAQIDLSGLMFKDENATVDDVLFWLACAYLHKGTEESQQANNIMKGMVERNIPGGRDRIIEKIEEVKNKYPQYLKNNSYLGDKIDESNTSELCFEKKQCAVSSKNHSSEGCYIATAVYGSYDCPEVWTLRRFRDLYLRRSTAGKALVNIYYKTSPIIVKLFGKTKCFNILNKKVLNTFVKYLNTKGYASNTYSDIVLK